MGKRVLRILLLALLVFTSALLATLLSKSAQADLDNRAGILYAGTANPGAIYKYIGDNDWRLISTEEDLDHAYAVLSLVEYEGQLYAGTMSTSSRSNSVGRVYRYDGGTTWTLVGDNMDNQVSSLAVYQGDLYAGTAWGAMNLYKYTPGTTNCNIPNWTRVVNYTDWSGTRTLYISHNYLLMGDIAWDRIGRWDGSTFYRDQTTKTGSCIYDFEDYGDYVYAAAYYGRMWRSSDGINWNRIFGSYATHMWELETFQNSLFMGYDNGELRESDGSDRGTLVFEAADGIISMETGGGYLYFGTGGEAGYYGKTTGTAEVYKYNGTGDPELISGSISMGTGVQCLYYGILSLLDKYAPILYFHEKEEFYPWGIYSMLNKAGLEFVMFPGSSKIPPICKPILNSVSRENLESDKYNDTRYCLNLKGYGPFSPFPFESIPTKKVWEKEYSFKVYGRYYEPPNHPDKIVLQYWFFYPFNNWDTGTIWPGNKHEGDWEMIQITLDKITKNVSLCCSHHEEATRYSWNDIDVIEGTHHPKIFVAKGGHGNWVTSGPHKVRDLVIWTLKDLTSEKGVVLYPKGAGTLSIEETKNKNTYELETISDEPPWVKWKGRWGEWSRFEGFYGPNSPANINYGEEFNRWRNPIEWCNSLPIGQKPSRSQYIALVQSTSPLLLHAYDRHGNHVGLTSNGKIETTISNTYLYIPSLSNRKEWMWIYTPEDLRFQIQGSSEGSFDFVCYRYLREKDKEITVVYQNIHFMSDTTATVDISPKNPEYIMEIDLDGDGIVDERRRPDTVQGTSTQNSLVVYPNPCNSNRGHLIKIANLPTNSKVYIYTISGDLVRTLDDSSEVTTQGSSAIATWDCENDAGEEVARGIYIYYVPKSKKTGKIAIIK